MQFAQLKQCHRKSNDEPRQSANKKTEIFLVSKSVTFLLL